LDGNNRTPGSKGVWLKNTTGSSGINNIRSLHMSYTKFDQAFQIGDAGSNINNFNNITGELCQFSWNNTAIEIQTINGEFHTWRNTTFINSSRYHVHALVGSALNLDHSYLGPLMPGAVAAVFGPLVFGWTDVVAELGERVPLLNVSGGGSLGQSSTITRLYNPSRGDAGGVSVYWNGVAPLTIVGSTIVGQVVWDSRREEGRVFLNGVTYT